MCPDERSSVYASVHVCVSNALIGCVLLLQIRMVRIFKILSKTGIENQIQGSFSMYYMQFHCQKKIAIGKLAAVTVFIALTLNYTVIRYTLREFEEKVFTRNIKANPLDQNYIITLIRFCPSTVFLILTPPFPHTMRLTAK